MNLIELVKNDQLNVHANACIMTCKLVYVHLKIAKLLLEHSADIHAKDDCAL